MAKKVFPLGTTQPDAIIERLKQMGAAQIAFNEETNTVEVGTNLNVDGKLSLNEANDLVDKDGNPLIQGGGAKLYKHSVQSIDLSTFRTGASFTFYSHTLSESLTGLTSFDLLAKLDEFDYGTESGAGAILGFNYASGGAEVEVYYFKQGSIRNELIQTNVTDNVTEL